MPNCANTSRAKAAISTAAEESRTPPDPLDPDPGGFDASASLFQRLSGPGEQEQGIVRTNTEEQDDDYRLDLRRHAHPQFGRYPTQDTQRQERRERDAGQRDQGRDERAVRQCDDQEDGEHGGHRDQPQVPVDGDFRIGLDQPDSRHRRPQRARASQGFLGLPGTGHDPREMRPPLEEKQYWQRFVAEQTPIDPRGIRLVLGGEWYGPLQAVRPPGFFVQAPDPAPYPRQISLRKPFGVGVNQYGRRLDRSRQVFGLRLGPGRRGRLGHHIREAAGRVAAKRRQIEVRGERYHRPEEHHREAEPDQEPAEHAEEASGTHHESLHRCSKRVTCHPGFRRPFSVS